MLALFVLGLSLAVGLALLVRGLLKASPEALARAVTVLAAGIGALAMLSLILTRRFDLIVAGLSLLLPVAAHWRHLWRRMKAEQGPAAGKTSEVSTRHLRMVLNHDTGSMAGTVLSGTHQGQSLEELDETALFALLSEYRRTDGQSATLLEAWLDRMHGGGWRDRFDSGADAAGADAGRSRSSNGGPDGASGGDSGPMSRAYALSILGLQPGATEAEIRAAHRRLMVKLHPDHGGSSALAAQINRARDVLLKE